MEHTNLRAENALAHVDQRDEKPEDAVRTLRDLELALVGGGDGPYGWP